MRGHFSIEWMAQSSISACSTRAENLPGFYCRHKTEPEQSRGLDVYGLTPLQQQTPHSLHEAGFSSGTEEETSGYESEGAQFLSPPAPVHHTATSLPSPPTTPAPSPPPGRRPRTAFTADQVGILEAAFKRNAYLGTQEKADLCKQLGLSDKQIRNWFQNRRMKLKRTVQDALAHTCQANVASQFMHYPQLQGYRSGPYPRYQAAVQDGLAHVSYLHPYGLQYTSPLPLDSFYQYSSPLEVMLPPTTAPLMGPYPTYPHHHPQGQ